MEMTINNKNGIVDMLALNVNQAIWTLQDACAIEGKVITIEVRYSHYDKKPEIRLVFEPNTTTL